MRYLLLCILFYLHVSYTVADVQSQDKTWNYGSHQNSLYLFDRGTSGAVTIPRHKNSFFICGNFNGTVCLSPCPKQCNETGATVYTANGGIFITRFDASSKKATWFGVISGNGFQSIVNCYIYSVGSTGRLYILGKTTNLTKLDIDPTTAKSDNSAVNGNGSFVSVLDVSNPYTAPKFLWGLRSKSSYNAVAETSRGAFFVGQTLATQNSLPDAFVQQVDPKNGNNVWRYGLASSGTSNYANVKKIGASYWYLYFSMIGQGGKLNPSTSTLTLPGNDTVFQLSWKLWFPNGNVHLDFSRLLTDPTKSPTLYRDIPNAVFDGVCSLYYAVNYQTTAVNFVNDATSLNAPAGPAVALTKRTSSGLLQWIYPIVPVNALSEVYHTDIDSKHCGTVIGGYFKGTVNFGGGRTTNPVTIRTHLNNHACFVLFVNTAGWFADLKVFPAQNGFCRVTSVSMADYCSSITVGGNFFGLVSFQELRSSRTYCRQRGVEHRHNYFSHRSWSKTARHRGSRRDSSSDSSSDSDDDNNTGPNTCSFSPNSSWNVTTTVTRAFFALIDY